ncbi:cell division protein FtsQ/DivIB [Martelella mediterranea]|uniref:Cell division protein FtsQ n=1 Tax=Martelella mediterranea TaxID=293089 RepID=A0A4R3NXE3_9HYPH|nr:cell division protein FtsQ/DivIB [Martelella mediterranea]TCT43156.1 cell division protein FtsQ [Martelella mediterranea]
MFTLNGNRQDKAAAGVSGCSRGGVLPRPLRRVARFSTGLVSGRAPVPAHTGTALAIVFFVAVGANAIAVSGKGELVQRAAIEVSGFSIEDIQISGNQETSEIAVLQALGLDDTISLQGLDIQVARGRLLNMPWVADAEVRKVYPSTLKIALQERKPYALWQQEDGRLLMIERDGNVIGPMSQPKFRSLPLVLGEGANFGAEKLDTLLAEWPELGDRVRAFKRVDRRRWDLYLNNGVIVKLPDSDTDAAVARLKGLEQSRSILEREVAAIDLRLNDRVAVQLTPAAMERREAATEALEKTFKNKGRRL